MKKNIRQNVLLKNIFSLTILNGLNLFLPLVTIPYLIATIGSSNYGAYSIAYSIIQYVLLVSTFGFGYTTTKLIAQNKSDILFVSRTFYATIMAKLLLGICAAVVCLVVVLLFFSNYIILYLFGLGIVLGDLLNPVWLYQGMEDMKYITLVNGLTKILFTALIFIFITSPNDYIYVLLFNSIGYLSAGIISFIIAHKRFGIRYLKIYISDVFSQIREAWVVFCSSAFVNLFNNSFVVILGLFVSESSVGIYAAVDKIIKAAKLVVDPISNALFPHLASKFGENSNKDNVRMLISYSGKLFIILLTIMIITDIAAPYICNTFLNSIKNETTVLIRYMSPLIILGGMNYLLGMVGLINLNSQTTWLKILSTASIGGLILLLLTVKRYGIEAAIWSSLFTESLLLALIIGKLHKIKNE